MKGTTVLRAILLLPVLLTCGAIASFASGGGEGAAPTQAIHLKGWYYWAPDAVADPPKFNDQTMFKVLQKKFNIFIDWTTVAADGQAQLGLIIASGDLPDIIGRILTTQLAQEYGRQGAYIALEDLIARHAPTLTAAMKANPAYRGQTVAPDGHIYFFPRLLEDLPRNFPGYQIRQDWLDTLKLPMPNTMVELEAVLKAFRDKDPNGNGKADEIPWSSDPGPLAWPFGIGFRGYNNSTDMFVEDNRIKYGPTDPRYKDALTLMSRWFAEKLIDNEYLGQPGSQFNTKVLGDRVGADFGSYAGYLTFFNKMARAEGKKTTWVAMPPPMGPTGIRSSLGGHMELDPACGAAITSKSKYPEAITRMMDYMYTEEGRLLLYFGIEGDTYTMVDGKPVYTDKVTKHPSLAIYQYLNTYNGHLSTWPSIVPGYHQLQLYDQEGKEAIQISAKYAGNRKIPILQFSAEEIKEVQTVGRDVDTFVNEWAHGFIRGTKSIANDWQAFQDGLKKLNVERLTALYQTAYARYLKNMSM